MVNMMTSYFSEFNLICPQQFGFLRGKSAFDAVNSVVEFIYSSFNKKETCVSVFLDMRKPFDTVQHYILVKKLENYGFRGVISSWFESYLSNRHQMVRIVYITA